MTTIETGTPTLRAGTWNIEPAHSSVGFAVRHLGLTKVRGQFNQFSGVLSIAEVGLESTVEAVIELSSVDTNNADRDGHLQSTDFFGAENNPQMVFKSTAVTEDTLSGELTLNGITKPVSLDLEIHGVTVDGYGMTRAGFSATGRILRSDFGVEFNMPVGLDGMLIGDKVDIELEIQAVPA